jgi:glutathionylspermidine amidase/synthetase
MRLAHFLLYTLLWSPCVVAEENAPVFPVACQEKCFSPYGARLGATADGIEAYSNCQPKCVYEKPSLVGNDFAGIEWQCVEFARRWLMKEKGLTFGSIEVAADLWNKVDHLERLQTKERVQLHQILNGAKASFMGGTIWTPAMWRWSCG